MTCIVVTRFGVLASEVVLARAIQDPYLLLELLLMWERFWGVKAGGSHSTEALASVTTALCITTSFSLIYAPNHLGVNPDSPDGTQAVGFLPRP